MDVKEFVVERSIWYRGNHEESSLFTSDGKYCALGFYLKACGIEDEEMLDVSSPHFTRHKSLPSWLVGEYLVDCDSFPNKPSALSEKAVDINDDDTKSDEEREKELTELFAEQGIKVIFR